MPYATGGGYWSSDPTSAGWLSPSQTISQYRLQIAPGAVWAGDLGLRKPLGNLNATTFLAIQEDHLVGIDLLTGDQLWSAELTPHLKDTLLDPAHGMLYITDTVQGLLAYLLPTDETREDPYPEGIEPLWEQKLPSSGHMDLMPLPDGGVLVSYKDTLSAFSIDGDLLWREESHGYLNVWALAEETLLFTTSDEGAPLLSANAQGLVIWEENLLGTPLVAGGQAWIYAEDGLYRLDLEDRTAQRLYDLPTALMRQSTALSLSNGGLVLLHADSADRRLLVFDEDGALNWQFSVPMDGTPQLFELEGRIYLLTHPPYSGRGAFRTMQVFEVDLQRPQLNRIFECGSRTFNPRTTWAVDVNGQFLLIHIAGAGSLLLDPNAALERMDR
jgi:outer membrane protein assembly factor BamB